MDLTVFGEPQPSQLTHCRSVCSGIAREHSDTTDSPEHSTWSVVGIDSHLRFSKYRDFRLMILNLLQRFFTLKKKASPKRVLRTLFLIPLLHGYRRQSSPMYGSFASCKVQTGFAKASSVSLKRPSPYSTTTKRIGWDSEKLSFH